MYEPDICKKCRYRRLTNEEYPCSVCEETEDDGGTMFEASEQGNATMSEVESDD